MCYNRYCLLEGEIQISLSSVYFLLVQRLEYLKNRTRFIRLPCRQSSACRFDSSKSDAAAMSWRVEDGGRKIFFWILLVNMSLLLLPQWLSNFYSYLLPPKCVGSHLRVHACTHMHTHVQHTHTHTYTHTHTHTDILVASWYAVLPPW